MQFTHRFKIEKKGDGLCVVFNVKNPKPGEADTVSLSETSILNRIKEVEGGGKSASIEKEALYELQRQTPHKYSPL